MRVCMCVYKCVYCMYEFVYACAYVYVCVYVCIHVYEYLYICTSACIRINACWHVCMCVCSYLFILLFLTPFLVSYTKLKSACTRFADCSCTAEKLCERDLLIRSLRSNCLGRWSNPYSPRYRTTAQINRSTSMNMHTIR